LFQFGRDVPVEVFARAAVEVPVSAEDAASKENSEEQKPRKEDWLLVRGLAGGGPEGEGAKPDEKIEIAGWVVARFVDLDLPQAIRDYASSSGLRPIAWFELDRVQDASGEKPQYLAVGVHGGEGQACDFTLLRVYTWGARRNRYETAYVESGLCGYLPVRVGKDAKSGDPEFRFAALGKSGKEERLYRMRQTVVRCIRESPATKKR
jgi:hypothetical protein